MNHIPERARVYSSWNRETFLNQAHRIGPNTYKMITIILASREFEVQTYRSCVGVLNLRKQYGDHLLEQACGQALDLKVRSRKGIKTILSILEQESEVIEDTPDEDDIQQYYCTHDDEPSGGSYDHE